MKVRYSNIFWAPLAVFVLIAWVGPGLTENTYNALCVSRNLTRIDACPALRSSVANRKAESKNGRCSDAVASADCGALGGADRAIQVAANEPAPDSSAPAFVLNEQQARSATGVASYRINSGDVLHITLWGEEFMDRDALVLPDGTFSYPLAGHISAAGLTLEQVESILIERLETKFPDPDITASVQQASGNRVFVIGQVQSPGVYQLGEALNVMQVLSLAGGLMPFAEKNGIKILRRTNGQSVALRFRYSAVESGRELESNVPLQSGDVVVVPTRGIF